MPLLIFRLCIACVVAVICPYVILSSHAAPMASVFSARGLAGGLLIIVGAILYVSCARDFSVIGPPVLVAHGSYRVIRNPMYVGLALMLAGETLFSGSWRLLGYSICVWVCIDLYVILHEERALRRRFGAAYETYCRSVPRWIPRLKDSPLH
jgi:protein-S-isoprenylcysteine O-methyltransferase Ste14